MSRNTAGFGLGRETGPCHCLGTVLVAQILSQHNMAPDEFPCSYIWLGGWGDEDEGVIS